MWHLTTFPHNHSPVWSIHYPAMSRLDLWFFLLQDLSYSICSCQLMFLLFHEVFTCDHYRAHWALSFEFLQMVNWLAQTNYNETLMPHSILKTFFSILLPGRMFKNNWTLFYLFVSGVDGSIPSGISASNSISFLLCIPTVFMLCMGGCSVNYLPID